jgi:hypothetical protein
MTSTVFFILGWVIVFLLLIPAFRRYGRGDERRREVSD